MQISVSPKFQHFILNMNKFASSLVYGAAIKVVQKSEI